MTRSSQSLLEAVRTMELDRWTVVAVGALADRGVDSLLLKGPTFAQWLYRDGTSRPYRDVDLLVPPRAYVEAERVLASLGLSPSVATPPGTWELHARDWRYESGQLRMSVDLHRSIQGVELPDLLWETLWRGRTEIRIAGRTIYGLDDVGRTMHVALHAAARPDPHGKAEEDLLRAIELVPIETWRLAASLARDVGALPAMIQGLRKEPAGVGIVAELGLVSDSRRSVKLRSAGATSDVLSLDALLGESTTWRRLKHGVRKVLPPPSWMRQRYGVGSSRTRLALAYGTRVRQAATRIVPAALSLRRLNRSG